MRTTAVVRFPQCVNTLRCTLHNVEDWKPCISGSGVTGPTKYRSRAVAQFPCKLG